MDNGLYCIVVHNILSVIRDDNSWLQEETNRDPIEQAEQNHAEREESIQAKLGAETNCEIL